MNISLGGYDCRALGRGEIFLQGNNDTSHIVKTSGEGANGLYANGNAYIKANNIDVSTTGAKANGIVAQRRSADFYYNSSTTGAQDFSGEIDLIGNVTVSSSGEGSYALLADSFSDTDGKDSRGIVASIRSFDSTTQKAVTDKIYKVTGNIRATNSGLIDLTMADESRFIGTTTADANGIVNLAIDGSNSLWSMTGDSSLTKIALTNGARFHLGKSGADLATYVLNGQFNNGGIIDLALNGSGTAGDSLTINGNYTSNGGVLTLKTKLGDDNSQTDKLIVNGDTSGNTLLRVINAGGTGAQTVEGIKIIEVSGASEGKFALENNFLIAGAYTYRLHQNNVTGNDPNNWYLRSSYNPTEPEKPELHVAASTYESYPSALLHMNKLGTLQQRVGNRQWGQTSESNTISPFWIKTEGEYTRANQSYSSTGASLKQDSFKLQAGVSSPFMDTETGELIGEAFVQYLNGSTKVQSADFADSKIKTEGFGFGAALTWYGAEGLYIDTQAQTNFFSSDLSSSASKGLLIGANDGRGFSISAEVGQHFSLEDNLSITPQAQLTYSRVSADAFKDFFDTSVSIGSSDNLKLRAGVAINYDYSASTEDGQPYKGQFYGIANINHELLGSTSVDLAGLRLSSKPNRTTGSIGLGTTYSWNDDKVAVYAEGLVETGFKNFGDDYSLRGNIGIRIKW